MLNRTEARIFSALTFTITLIVLIAIILSTTHTIYLSTTLLIVLFVCFPFLILIDVLNIFVLRSFHTDWRVVKKNARWRR